MKKESEFEKFDYHYLVVENKGHFYFVNNMGELSFPCIQLAPNDNIADGIRSFVVAGYIHHWTGDELKSEAKVFKQRNCGVRRILHYVQDGNVTCDMSKLIEVPVYQAVTNKPAILSAEAKAILRALPGWNFWKSDVKFHGGYIYSHSVRRSRGR